VNFDWQPLLLTFKLATLTTLILLVIGVPLAYWLSFSRVRFKSVFEALVAMPLVLPPSVLGFYLLLAFSPQHAFGHFLETVFDVRLLFTFAGLVVGSVIFSLPFMVQPVQAGFEALPVSLAEAAATLGKSRWQTFRRVLLPNIRPALLSGTVLAFAHTIGEFGVVLMIGGNIPGQTQVASLAIYNEVESLHYGAAHFYALILFALSFTILLSVYTLNKRLLKTL
jgi:molybdate transport system permease protein